MVPRQLLLGATILCLLVGAGGAWLYVRQRAAACDPLRALTPQLLPNAGLAPGDDPGMPAGWSRRAVGVELRGPAVDGQGFELDGDGRALQLIGVGNYAQAPAVPVRPGAPYCFTVRALSDNAPGTPTRARLVFQWQDSGGATLEEQATLWQPVAIWTPDAPPREWAPIRGGFVAPNGASRLAVRVEPVADDGLYLDRFGLYQGGQALTSLAAPRPADRGPLAPWPYGRSAAVAFTFDWETSMGGLVHSRSVDDPNFTQDHVLRGMRMREGVTTTLQLFAPLGVRATYYATGYNFLDGNVERRRFMGDPTFSWATRANGWTSDRWASTPWFADDPFGTVASDPAWYFGDLVAPLQAAGQEIQSHTFSHLHGGLADLATWQRDLEDWNAVAAEQGVGAATSIAFPWSSSAGMGDAAWDQLERAGITSVTRLSDQAQYSLWAADADGVIAEPRCRWLPGREGRILACPDFYLTAERASLALEQLERAVAAGGMIDLFAHTEEVVTPEQVAAWGGVVERAAADPRIWVAPLGEIAAWQRALAKLELGSAPQADGAALALSVANPTDATVVGLALRLPAGTQRVTVNGDALQASGGPQPGGAGFWPAAGLAILDLAPGQRVEVSAWSTP
jgi:hypothetical protein